MLDPDRIAQFARRIAADDNTHMRAGSAAGVPGLRGGPPGQVQRHYHDFVPRADGNIQCMMDGYIRRRDRTAYIVDTRSGFIARSTRTLSAAHATSRHRQQNDKEHGVARRRYVAGSVSLEPNMKDLTPLPPLHEVERG